MPPNRKATIRGAFAKRLYSEVKISLLANTGTSALTGPVKESLSANRYYALLNQSQRKRDVPEIVLPT